MLTWPVFDALDVDVMVTTRHGGVSSRSYASLNLGLHVGDADKDVLENRRRAAAALGADSRRHRVLPPGARPGGAGRITPADRGRGALRREDAIPGTDALVTSDPGIVLVVMVADCVPIVLYDPAAHVLACVARGVARHGRPGQRGGGGGDARPGARPGNVIAGLGPAISPDGIRWARTCTRRQQGLGASAAQVVREDGTGKWLFDLWTANRLVLGRPAYPKEASRGGDSDRIGCRPVLQRPGGPALRAVCGHRAAARPGGSVSASGRRGTCSATKATIWMPRQACSHAGTSVDGRGLRRADDAEPGRATGSFTGGPAPPPGWCSCSQGFLTTRRRRLQIIDLGHTAITDRERDFLHEFYLQGLAEFAYRNDMDLAGFAIEAPVVRAVPMHDPRPVPVTGRRWSRSAAASTRS